jgi:DNA processing protein
MSAIRRDASWQGLRTANALSRDLAAAGAVVVSGLARGIDSAAHRGALEAGGRTVAVLGNGLCDIYPSENNKLAREAASSGAVVSEFLMEEPPKPMNFPMRNRILSGLSRAVIVVEAREKSGALITVDCALEQGREVYVFPGDAGSKRTFGSNDLLKQGAKPATGAEDILRDFGLTGKKAKPAAAKLRPALNAEEKALLRLLKKAESLHVDQIVEKSVLSPQQTMTLLTTMAVKGVVRELPGKYFTEAQS